MFVYQGDTPKSEKSKAKPQTPPSGQKKTLKGGLLVEDIKVGHGPEAKAGQTVSAARAVLQRLCSDLANYLPVVTLDYFTVFGIHAQH